MSVMQRALALIYPEQCVLCSELVDQTGALCAECWRETQFLTGHTCDKCAAPLPGQSHGVADLCDDCIATERPWDRGRAVFQYHGAGRRLVLGLKNGDRTDLVPAAAAWMSRAGRSILVDKPLLVPVPAHWTRYVRRRYNQAAELARALAGLDALEFKPNALVRRKKTRIQDGMTVDERFLNVEEAIVANSRQAGMLRGRDVCLIDDVMTSGATLAASATAVRAAGANRVSVLVLARVVKTP